MSDSSRSSVTPVSVQENPDGGRDLFTTEHAGVKPYGNARDPINHFQSVDPAGKCLEGEGPDPLWSC